MNTTSRLDWTHFYIGSLVQEKGRITGFTPDVCENCGGPVQAANSITLHETPIRLLRLGLVQADALPPEGYYSEQLGGEACDDCNG